MRARLGFLFLGLAGLGALGANLVVLERARWRVEAENIQLRTETMVTSGLEWQRMELQRQLEAFAAQDLSEKVASIEPLTERLRQARLRYQRAMMNDFPPAGAEPQPAAVPWKPVVEWKRGKWQVRGRGSALDALETLIACTAAGDADGVERAIALNAADQSTATGILNTMTPGTRAVWSTPRSLVATLLTLAADQGCEAVTVLGVQEGDPTLLFIRWKDERGGTRDLLLQAVHGADGYRILVPVMAIQRAEAFSAGEIDRPR